MEDQFKATAADFNAAIDRAADNIKALTDAIASAAKVEPSQQADSAPTGTKLPQVSPHPSEYPDWLRDLLRVAYNMGAHGLRNALMNNRDEFYYEYEVEFEKNLYERGLEVTVTLSETLEMYIPYECALDDLNVDEVVQDRAHEYVNGLCQPMIESNDDSEAAA